MYFQLLVGSHIENKVQHQAVVERDEKGAVVKVDQPIFKSDKDLVELFGREKFRRVEDREATLLLQGKAAESRDASNSAALADNKDEVAKAVEEGAAEIAEPPGTDVTAKFPEVGDPFKVYFKRGKGYFVASNGKVVTEEPLKRNEVVNWVESFSMTED